MGGWLGLVLTSASGVDPLEEVEGRDDGEDGDSGLISLEAEARGEGRRMSG